MADPMSFYQFLTLITMKRKRYLFVGQSKNSKTPFSLKMVIKSSLPQSSVGTLSKTK